MYVSVCVLVPLVGFSNNCIRVLLFARVVDEGHSCGHLRRGRATPDRREGPLQPSPRGDIREVRRSRGSSAALRRRVDGMQSTGIPVTGRQWTGWSRRSPGHRSAGPTRQDPRDFRTPEADRAAEGPVDEIQPGRFSPRDPPGGPVREVSVGTARRGSPSEAAQSVRPSRYGPPGQPSRASPDREAQSARHRAAPFGAAQPARLSRHGPPGQARSGRPNRGSPAGAAQSTRPAGAGRVRAAQSARPSEQPSRHTPPDDSVRAVQAARFRRDSSVREPVRATQHTRSGGQDSAREAESAQLGLRDPIGAVQPGRFSRRDPVGRILLTESASAGCCPLYTICYMSFAGFSPRNIVRRIQSDGSR